MTYNLSDQFLLLLLLLFTCVHGIERWINGVLSGESVWLVAVVFVVVVYAYNGCFCLLERSTTFQLQSFLGHRVDKMNQGANWGEFTDCLTDFCCCCCCCCLRVHRLLCRTGAQRCRFTVRQSGVSVCWQTRFSRYWQSSWMLYCQLGRIRASERNTSIYIYIYIYIYM